MSLRPGKVLLLPQDIDDPLGWGEAWAVVATGLDRGDTERIEKAKAVWWRCYEHATVAAAERAGFRVIHRTGRIGTPEYLEDERRLSEAGDGEPATPATALDMNDVDADAKWRFAIAWQVVMGTWGRAEERQVEEQEDGEEE